MSKRKRNEDLPRRKRLHLASVSLLQLEWVGREVMSADGVTRNTDGTFSLKFRKGCVLTKQQVDTFVSAVNTETEVAYVRFSATEDGFLIISVENEYPAASAMRRKTREKETDPWWRNLDLHDKNGTEATADEVWSNELADIPKYDRHCLMTVSPLESDPNHYAIHFLRPTFQSKPGPQNKGL